MSKYKYRAINPHSGKCTGFNYMVTASLMGFGYEQVLQEVKRLGFITTNEQYDAIDKLVNISIAIDIGTQQHLKEEEEEYTEQYIQQQPLDETHDQSDESCYYLGGDE